MFACILAFDKSARNVDCVVAMLTWSHLCLSSDDGGDACGLARSRSRREKREKVGRKSALEQLKRAKKGEKVKYEVRNPCVCVHCETLSETGFMANCVHVSTLLLDAWTMSIQYLTVQLSKS